MAYQYQKKAYVHKIGRKFYPFPLEQPLLIFYQRGESVDIAYNRINGKDKGDYYQGIKPPQLSEVINPISKEPFKQDFIIHALKKGIPLYNKRADKGDQDKYEDKIDG